MRKSRVAVPVAGSLTPLAAAHADTTSIIYANNAVTNCSDTASNSGSPTVPYCTVQAAANVVMPGQTVQIAAGSYPGQVTISRSGTAA